MARITFTETPEEKSTLEELISRYAMNKQERDSYDAICKKENEEIKSMMSQLNTDEYEAGGYKAKKVVQHRVSMNEARLMAVIKEFNIPGIIQTCEYVNMDALENYLHNEENVPAEFTEALASCKTTNDVVTLKVTKVKDKKEAE